MTDIALVIGGSGFMGSHTADELTARGYEVRVFDVIPSPWLKPTQKFICGDILDLNALRAACEGVRFVYHFAGIADIAEAKVQPLRSIELNVMGVTTALEAIVMSGVERFVYASTMYVYSAYGSFYRASKQSAETIIRAYAENYDFDFTILRYGSLYGPRAQRWNGLRRYVESIVRDKKIHYVGTGRERREYIHALDAARLSVDILDERHRNKAIIVTGQQVLESSLLIEMIFEISGIVPDVVFEDSKTSTDHYRITPYRFESELATKLVPDEFIDIGQGILDTVREIIEQNEIPD